MAIGLCPQDVKAEVWLVMQPKNRAMLSASKIKPLHKYLIQETKQRFGVEVPSQGDTLSLTAAVEKGMNQRCDQPSCLAVLSEQIGADQILLSEIYRQGSNCQVTLSISSRKDLESSQKYISSGACWEDEIQQSMGRALSQIPKSQNKTSGTAEAAGASQPSSASSVRRKTKQAQVSPNTVFNNNAEAKKNILSLQKASRMYHDFVANKAPSMLTPQRIKKILEMRLKMNPLLEQNQNNKALFPRLADRFIELNTIIIGHFLAVTTQTPIEQQMLNPTVLAQNIGTLGQAFSEGVAVHLRLATHLSATDPRAQKIMKFITRMQASVTPESK
ncbi:MAG: hypothetical protein VYC39_15335 [Myxococcota bacterium]|nr:hypothetical protein [Myxococcota bacterium]